MTPTLLWVIGRGGLLGSHLEHVIGTEPQFEVWQPSNPSLAWEDYPTLSDQFSHASCEFISHIKDLQYNQWGVAWTAGKGVVATSANVLCAETQNFQCFLTQLGDALRAKNVVGRGLFFLASSAGGVYAGSTQQPVTEYSPCKPLSDYGKSKLTQEKILEHWSGAFDNISYLIGRITNLYGFGLNRPIAKGFIAHLARCMILRRPFHLYVGLDTIRDFITVEDCAAAVVRCFQEMASSSATIRATKIFAAEQSTSLATVVGEMARITKRTPQLVCSASQLGEHQPRQLQFKSQVWSESMPRKTPLNVGLFRAYQRQLALYLQGVA